jgi:Protein of unknown function (DUF3106)
VAKAPLKLIFGLLLAFALALSASAQQSPTQQSPDDTAGAGAKSKPQRPLWSELSPKQQAVLAPLAADWETLDTTRRKKWVTIANRYPKMKPDEQVRLQRRMQDWAALTPAQRRVARENYKALRQIPRPKEPGELRQKWDQHKQSQPAPDSAAAPDTGVAPGK